MIHIKNQIVHK